MIRRLADDVQHKLRSGVAIASAAQCVEELILNSTDSGATCIAVRVDLEAHRVQVVDNGSGLAEEDMRTVGTRYYTSKCHSLRDLEALRCYGFRGEAIASIVDVSGVVEITSKHKDARKTLTKLFQNGKPVHAQEAGAQRPSPGTTVTVCNLFYNLPVRRRHADPGLEFERIRQRVEAASLAQPHVSYTLKNDALHSMVLQLPKAKDSRSRFCQISGLRRAQTLREVQHAQGGFEVRGFISSEGHYNKSMQYLYVNERLVLKTRLHKLIDSVLRKESAICRPRNASSGTAEPHAVFVINIRCSYCQYDVCFEPAKTLIEFQDWESVLTCLQGAVRAFLRRESLLLEPPEAAEPSETRRPGLWLIRDKETFRNVSDRLVDNSNLTHFASKAVCRSEESRMLPDPIHAIQNDQEARDNAPETDTGDPRPAACPSHDATPSGDVICASLKSETREGRTKDFVHHSEGVRRDSIMESPEGSGGVTCPSLKGECPRLHPQPPILRDSHLDVSDTATERPVLRDTSESVDCRLARCSAPSQDVSCLPRERFSRPGPVSAAEIFGSRWAAAVSRAGLTAPRCNPRRDTTRSTKASQEKESKMLGRPRWTGSLQKFGRLYGRAHSPSWRDRRGRKESNWGVFSNLRKPAVHLESGAEANDTQKPTGTHVERAGEMATSSLQTAQLQRDASGPRETSRPPTAKLSRKAEETPAGDSSARRAPSCQHAPPSARLLEEKQGSVSTERADETRGTQQGHRPNDLVCGPATTVSAPSSAVDTPVSSDWLQCYEASLGKNVFVNKCTGLSSYIGPRRETRAACRSNQTSAAASVACAGAAAHLGDASLRSAFTQWENPVFERHPSVAVDVSCGHLDTLAVKIHNILHPYRFTKEMIHSMEVLQQVDRKFIACLMTTGEENSFPGGNLLVLVDQHAAHERVRLEQLIADSYERPSDDSAEKQLKVSVVEPPLELDVTDEQHRLFRVLAGRFRKVGLSLRFPDSGAPRVLVTEVPLCFLEKEANETQRGRSTVAKKMVEDFLQEHVELLQTGGAAHGRIPLTVLKVLASQACHGAVKFNDSLTVAECGHLIRALAGCNLPFQCAHGRPAILPLADISHLEQQVTTKPNVSRLGRQQRAWEQRRETAESVGAAQGSDPSTEANRLHRACL